MALGCNACDWDKPSCRIELCERGRYVRRSQEGRDLENRHDWGINPDRPADRVCHHGVVARVCDSSEALQLSGQVGSCGLQARSRGRLEVHRLERRQEVHLHHPEGLQVQRRQAGDGEQLQVRHQPRREPRPGLARRAVHHRPERHAQALPRLHHCRLRSDQRRRRSFRSRRKSSTSTALATCLPPVRMS